MKEPLQDWMNRTIEATPDGMIYKKAMISQTIYARDTLSFLFSRGLDDISSATVIGEHVSKSVTLPVYNFERPDCPLRIIARNNFYDWKFSVISEEPIIAGYSGLFQLFPPPDLDYTGNPLHPVYFEGFERENVFGYHSENPRKFSGSVGTNESFWTMIFLTLRSVGKIAPIEWGKRK